MREKLVCILLITSLSLNAQRNSDNLYSGIPQITGDELKLKQGFTNRNAAVFLSHPGPATVIRIRCAATIYSVNQPLYVVDGVLYEATQIKSIRPNDIERIDVLNSPRAEVIFGCRAVHGVVIITTKKYYDREFVVKDAKDRIGISYATITASSIQTGNSVVIVANEFGRIETSLLKSMDYRLTITSAGYKSKQIMLREAAISKYEILLERDAIDLKEITIFPGIVKKCGFSNWCNLPVDSLGASLSRSFRCISKGVNIYEEKKQLVNLPIKETKVNIYPNPVSSSSTVNLSFPNVKEGLYQVRLLNAAGQLFYSVQKQINGKNETEQIHLNSQMIPGIYMVQIIDAQKKLVQTTQLIIQ